MTAAGGRLEGEGPVVVITGAAGGIGSALAWRWARDGARLGLLDVDRDRLARLRDDLSRAGHDVLACVCDVTDEPSCRDAVEEVAATFGGVDVVVANAGRTHLSLASDTDVSVLRRVMELNYFGAVNVVRAALPALMRTRGRIVVLSSVAGFAPLAGRSGYAASKHALHGFFGSLRGEVAGAGVSVTLVCPAFVRTEMGTRALRGDGGAATRDRTETGTPMDAEAVADAVVRAAGGRKRLVVLSAVGRASWWLWKVAPRLYEWIMVRRRLREEA